MRLGRKSFLTEEKGLRAKPLSSVQKKEGKGKKSAPIKRYAKRGPSHKRFGTLRGGNNRKVCWRERGGKGGDGNGWVLLKPSFRKRKDHFNSRKPAREAQKKRAIIQRERIDELNSQKMKGKTLVPEHLLREWGKQKARWFSLKKKSLGKGDPRS